MLEQTLGQYYSFSPKSTMKLVRLGKVRSDNFRPLKMVLLSKDHTISFLRGFNEAKFKSVEFPTSSRNVRDKNKIHERCSKNCSEYLKKQSCRSVMQSTRTSHYVWGSSSIAFINLPIQLFSLSTLEITSVNHNLCIFYQNLCGLRTKLFNVRSSFPSFTSYDIIILTKIWLSPVIYRNELVFDGFLVFRQHINSSNSNFSCNGGILIAIKTNLKTTTIPPGNVDVEQAFITLTLDSFSVLVGMLITNIISTTHWFLLILCSLSLNLKFHTSSVEQLI
ncbi:hypothetical protein AGLY_017087 [Aphis glycines]|uniref:Uncharacterized protein n=1 Tax=Aphis glycines TaxID=307491 RepID=A0A6G0SW84_APHGL|nr:hypothetical protein AGLY_017087 [Aphis glycines]